MQQESSALLETYFQGLYRSDVTPLKSAFRPQAQLFGEVRGSPYFNALEKFLAAVAGRQSSQQRGEELRMQEVQVLD